MVVKSDDPVQHDMFTIKDPVTGNMGNHIIDLNQFITVPFFLYKIILLHGSCQYFLKPSKLLKHTECVVFLRRSRFIQKKRLQGIFHILINYSKTCDEGTPQ